MKRLTKEEFVNKAKHVHGNKYDYSLVNYVRNSENVRIICPIHGLFEQKPANHLQGKGCYECSRTVRGVNKRKTNECFIKDAKTLYGNRYDYSNVDYINSKTKVTIKCQRHGFFSQTPGNHLSGKEGCPMCQEEKMQQLHDKKRFSKSQFIDKAQEVHGDRYDYSAVQYVNANTLVNIICRTHGVFPQKPYVHVNLGCGCPKCGKIENIKHRSLSTSLFINRAKKVHGNKYDYSLVNYINDSTPVTIICPEHGPFEQRPGVHVGQKCGCTECGRNVTIAARKQTTEEFVARAKEIHGDMYDYSKTRYVNAQTPITIICPICGPYLQMPYVHLSGAKCSKCVGRQRTTDRFIEELRLVHGDRYDYSKVKYTKARNRIIIGCPTHGFFKQTAEDHLSGKGCPRCHESHMEGYIANLLTRNGIAFVAQKRFHWLRHIKAMSLDFYLPDINLAIECQGLQHFGIQAGRDNKIFDFDLIAIRDKLKYSLCKDHGIRVVYFCNNKDYIPDSYIDKIVSCKEELLSLIVQEQRSSSN